MYLPHYYPKPISYYQSPRFTGERGEIVTPAGDLNKISLVGADAALLGRVRAQLETIKFRRRGTLRGQYALIAGGVLAIDHNGTPIKLNCDSDDDWMHTSIFSYVENLCASHDFLRRRDNALSQWDDLPLVRGLPFLAELHAADNYYHFCTLFLPRVRHFADSPETILCLPPLLLERPFQRELIWRTFGARTILPCPNMTRIEDPHLLFEPFAPDGLAWLRDRVGLRARRGERRIYVNRRGGWRDGGIADEGDFARFLERHHFETIDFGTGEVPISTQIAMLDGARVVLSAHGAGLTNIAFAEEGISVIEILPYYWSCFTHMQLALAASLNYFGLVCMAVDDQKRMVIDTSLLSTVLEQALATA
jgi:hypothetical protein